MSYRLLTGKGPEMRGSLVWLSGVLCSPTRLPLAICFTVGNGIFVHYFLAERVAAEG
jgi:hypothetical protein